MEINNSPEYLQHVIDKLQLIKKGSGNEYIFRCPYCGDSQKNLKRGRFYLNIENNLWNCFNCGEKGHVNILLEDINLSNFKVKVKNDKRKLNIKNSKKESLIIPELTDNDIELYYDKIKYFIDRTKCKPEQLKKIPIVINYKNFLEMNQEKVTKNFKFIENNFDYCNKNYIGFYTDNKLITSFRNIDKKSTFRYDIFKIQNSDEDFIIITDQDKEKLKTIYHRPLRVLIAEGIFDILVPYLNNLFSDEKIDIYICSMGSTKLTNAIKYVSKEYCNVLDIIYCIDNDQLQYYKTYVYERIKYLCKSFKVYRNKLHKDMGEFPILKEKYIEFNTT